MSYFTFDFVGKNSMNFPKFVEEYTGKNSLCSQIAEFEYIGKNILYSGFNDEIISKNNLIGAQTKFTSDIIGINHLLAESGNSGSGLVYGNFQFDKTY